jgi:hypothetical protein
MCWAAGGADCDVVGQRGTAESRNQKELLSFSFVALSIRRNGLWSARPVSNPSNRPSGFSVAFPLLGFFLETRVPCCVCRIVPQTNIYTRGHSFVENLKERRRRKKRVAHNIRHSAQIQTPTTIKKNRTDSIVRCPLAPSLTAILPVSFWLNKKKVSKVQ